MIVNLVKILLFLKKAEQSVHWNMMQSEACSSESVNKFFLCKENLTLIKDNFQNSLKGNVELSPDIQEVMVKWYLAHAWLTGTDDIVLESFVINWDLLLLPSAKTGESPNNQVDSIDASIS